MNIVPADTLSIAELAELFTAGYEGYFVPIQVDAATIALHGRRVGHRPHALARRAGRRRRATSAVRGERAWIGGLGVVPAKRRRGVGRALMEAVLAEAPPLVTLEVIEQNEPAIRLYEQLGFERTRVARGVVAAGRRRRRGREGRRRRRSGRAAAVAARGCIAARGLRALRGRRRRDALPRRRPSSSSTRATRRRRSRCSRAGRSCSYVNVPEGEPASGRDARARRLRSTCASSRWR